MIEIFSAFHDSDNASLDLVFPVFVNLSFRFVPFRLSLALSSAGRLLHLDPVQLRREHLVHLKDRLFQFITNLVYRSVFCFSIILATDMLRLLTSWTTISLH